MHDPTAFVTFAPGQLANIDALLDQAVRARGLVLVEPVADLCRLFRAHRDAPGGIPIGPVEKATLVQASDAACRSGGLGMAEIAIGVLSAIALAEETYLELARDREQANREFEQAALERELALPEHLPADVTHVESVPPDAMDPS